MRIFALSVALAWPACATSSLGPGHVRTTQGVAEGVTEGGVTAFLGIPYAVADRWRLPEDGPAWTGVRRFDAFGPACPQQGQTDMVEACLFLNVFQPAGATPQANLPVVVWIHGGGLRAGQGGHGPRAFAHEQVVVVTFNYRLGLLGFRDWPGWGKDDPRNFGQADMVKALEWVQKNISAFGGQPQNVTLAGHSAGGMGVQLMMVDPRARGLFHRAIAHAGYGTWPFPRAMNPTPEKRQRLRLGPLGLDVAPEVLVRRVPYFHLPVVGGVDLPEQPSRIFEKGHQAKVPYMAGANSFDGYGTVDGAGFGVHEIYRRYGETPSVRAAYADDFEVSDGQAMARLFGDMRYVYASWKTVQAMQRVAQPGYLFYYDAASAGLPGAAHGAQYDRLFAQGDFPLKRYWLAFIKTATPAPPGDPRWPRYTEQAPQWMVFSPQPTAVRAARQEQMRVIGSLRFPGAQP